MKNIEFNVRRMQVTWPTIRTKENKFIDSNYSSVNEN